MQALVQTAFGRADDVLRLQELETPQIGPTDVLVRVRAAGIAKGNWLITHGLPYIARPLYGWRVPKQRVAGLQFAGVVQAVGAQVARFKPGAEVFGTHTGAYAEFVAAPESALARKPSRISFEQAATAPISGIAALQAVRDAGAVRAGHEVLVVGASGGVGSFAVQIAKALGARVTGVASTRNVEMVRSLGAADVIDYSREPIDARGARFDVIIDIAGNRPVSVLRRALTPSGTLVIVGGTGGRWTMGFQRTVGGMLLSPFVSQTIVGLLAEAKPSDLATLAELMESGKVTPVVASALPLARAAEAIEMTGAGRATGTLVLSITGRPGAPA